MVPGSVYPRGTVRGKSQAHPGVYPLSLYTYTQSFQPLPKPLGQPPYHYKLETSVPGIGDTAQKSGQLVFHVVGDTGGIKNPDHQTAVANAMVADLGQPSGQAPSFFYLVGDVVYFNGQIQDYYAQFFEPYASYNAPIISIPGNHDGDPIDASQTSLDGWVAYFMQGSARVDPNSGDAPRVTLSLPNVYFTLDCPFVTIIGMYTNVPEGGSVDSVQQQWLTNEFATAPADKALIVALHHPIYSFDDFHSGSARMADVVQAAMNDTSRVPNLVLTAHVHNYQRIERPIVSGSATPFIVTGNGGYYNLHKLNSSPGTTDSETSATLVAGDDQHWGYMILTVTAEKLSGRVFAVDPANSGAGQIDSFTYPAVAQYLPANTTVSL
jgi:hypothetical protein